ncbi:Aminotransferase class I and II [Pyrenophora tritici-repentis]|nr:Aminotransferase class I and II [Pyrenophora tritici-repentis]KAI2481331.1 Aminotransferase class I and II [Pyrenophora tritici-repentis]
MSRSQAETIPTMFTIQDREEDRKRSKSKISDLSEKQKDWNISVVKKLRRETCPNRVGTLAKLREYMLFASSEIWVRSQDGVQQFKALSANARFSHYVVDPFYRWYGLNDRVVITAGLGRIGLIDSLGQQDSCVNGGSFNYAGLYKMPVEYEALQRRCLNQLPHCGARDVQELRGELSRSIAAFFGNDCCHLTSTGFGANVLAFPAIIQNDWMVIMDEKCHKSMFVGSFLSEAGMRKRFKHNDMEELESILRTAGRRYSNIMVAVEGIYSMDGTMPPLEALNELKIRYKFTLYCDEAHSFLSVGRTGRGCLEYWNDKHPTRKLPADLIDIRSGTFSKAVGAIGGFVCTSRRFDAVLRCQNDKLAERCESLPTAAILQALWALKRPLHLANNIARLRGISEFCHEELDLQGVYVYGDGETPMLPVHTGAPTRASELSYLLRKLGLVCPPISKPAVGIWESRVRIGLSPDFTDEDVNTLNTRRLFKSITSRDSILEEETARALQEMTCLLDSQIAKAAGSHMAKERHPQNIVQAGYAALKKHGLGAGSSRFILGTFLPHLDAESLTAVILGQPAAITYADSGLGLMSTVAALCRPIISYSQHNFLVPVDAPSAVKDGLRVASRSCGTTVITYTGLEMLVMLLRAADGDARVYNTVYVSIRPGGGVGTDLCGLTARLATAQRKNKNNVTLLIDNDDGRQPTNVPSKISLGPAVNVSKPLEELSIRILISGSYRSALGLCGGYIAGDKAIVEELRYSSCCYMFSTSPLPMHMAMVTEALATSHCALENKSTQSGRGFHRSKIFGDLYYFGFALFVLQTVSLLLLFVF